MTNIKNQIHKIYFVTISLFFIAVAIFSLSVMTVNAEDGFKFQMLLDLMNLKIKY